jgi:hypothetical protein
MNSKSYIYNQENPSNQAPIKDLNERKIWDMEQDMELLQEQVKSLKQELAFRDEFANECLQELKYAKQELEWMNEEISNLINSNKLPINEANSLGSCISKPKGSANQSRTESVEVIAHFPSQINEFERVENSSMSSPIDTFKAKVSNIRAESHLMRVHSIQLRTESKQITVQCYKIKARSREISEHCCAFKERLGKKKASFPETVKMPNLFAIAL